MGQLLAKSSGGSLTVKVFSKGALGSEKETIDQVKLGALAMTRVHARRSPPCAPKLLVPALPFLYRSVEHMRKAIDGPAGDELLTACEHQGLVGLAIYDAGARSIYAKAHQNAAGRQGPEDPRAADRPVDCRDDGHGANPTPMPIGEVYTGLKTGLIDAAENNLPSYEGFPPHGGPRSTAAPSTR